MSTYDRQMILQINEVSSLQVGCGRGTCKVTGLPLILSICLYSLCKVVANRWDMAWPASRTVCECDNFTTTGV